MCTVWGGNNVDQKEPSPIILGPTLHLQYSRRRNTYITSLKQTQQMNTHTQTHTHTHSNPKTEGQESSPINTYTVSLTEEQNSSLSHPHFHKRPSPLLLHK